jgi:bacterioferritin
LARGKITVSVLTAEQAVPLRGLLFALPSGFASYQATTDTQSSYNKFSTKRAVLKESAMQGDPQMIDTLNKALTVELTAINQYFVQSKMCKNWGFEKLAKKHYVESIGEMKHADKLIDRILFLDGVPEIARYDIIRVGVDVKEQFENDLALESRGAKLYNEAIALAVKIGDNATREMLAEILVDSEEHVDWLETQLGLIDKIGFQNYLSEQITDDEE